MNFPKTMNVAAFALFASTCVVVAGCNTASAPEQTVERPPAALTNVPVQVAEDTPSPTGVPHVKNPIPAEPFGELTALSGKKVSLESLSGKVIVLDFWATWCGPCRMTIPMLKELHDKYEKEGLVIVGISDETKTQVEPFAERMEMNYTVVADPVTSITWQRNYDVQSLPTLAVIDRKGKVRLYETGLDTTPGKGTHDRLTELLPQLLAEK